MDRVLVAIDQIQYANHLEMTLRKVGFDVEVIANEFNLSEKLLTFNPDIIIVRGQSTKLSTLSVGRKLKDHLKYSGQVVLILGQDQKISPEDLIKIRMDLLLFEPMGVLKLTMSILNLDPVRKEMMQDRLLRMAETDPAFRTQEQSYLVSYGQDIDREIINVQGKISEADQDLLISDEMLVGFDTRQTVSNNSAAVAGENTSKSIAPEIISSEYKNNLQAELAAGRDELSLRIDTYNHQIKKLDQDLKKGLNKRQTKLEIKKQRAEMIANSGQENFDSLDQEKQKFAQALFRKSK